MADMLSMLFWVLVMRTPSKRRIMFLDVFGLDFTGAETLMQISRCFSAQPGRSWLEVDHAKVGNSRARIAGILVISSKGFKGKDVPSNAAAGPSHLAWHHALIWAQYFQAGTPLGKKGDVELRGACCWFETHESRLIQRPNELISPPKLDGEAEKYSCGSRSWYRWMWKSVLFAIERLISMRESNWGKSVLFAFSLGLAWQLESGTFKSCSNFHGYTNGNYGI